MVDGSPRFRRRCADRARHRTGGSLRRRAPAARPAECARRAQPAVTPTKLLLYNVVAGPGALLRYRRGGLLYCPLTRRLIVGTLPGVVLGALIRVFAVPGPAVFRFFGRRPAAPPRPWLVARTLRPTSTDPPAAPSPRTATALAVAIGAVGGVYGVGGGSILGPILVGRGVPVAQVAPAALASTFLTSLVGAGTYGLLSLTGGDDIAPDRLLGLACGLGGLTGGYLGARLQPHLPERLLRLLLGTLATSMGALYAALALSTRTDSRCSPLREASEYAEDSNGDAQRRGCASVPAVDQNTLASLPRSCDDALCC
ncbi:TSUP family transporter [Streptomyces sp. NPDC052016]|uniref:TSUP family transporter n=1 Tax=Streptomyces sp. NPDC052016 TaxID=3365680 RepID=UPI0037D84F25